MKHKIILEINGVRHKLIKTKVNNPCEKCSVKHICTETLSIFCGMYPSKRRFHKCKKGE